MSQSKVEKLGANLKGTTSLGDLSKCSMIVEAVFENLEVKKLVFSELDALARPDTLLLTNTSTLGVDQIAGALSRGRTALSAGMHFFSPAHVMRLVKIVRSSHTPPSMLSIIQGRKCDGFVKNRMLFTYTSEINARLGENDWPWKPLLEHLRTSPPHWPKMRVLTAWTPCLNCVLNTAAEVAKQALMWLKSPRCGCLPIPCITPLNPPPKPLAGFYALTRSFLPEATEVS